MYVWARWCLRVRCCVCAPAAWRGFLLENAERLLNHLGGGWRWHPFNHFHHRLENFFLLFILYPSESVLLSALLPFMEQLSCRKWNYSLLYHFWGVRQNSRLMMPLSGCKALIVVEENGKFPFQNMLDLIIGGKYEVT